MSSELADVYNQKGELTGEQKTKEQIFADGDWRLVIHIWIVDPDSHELLVQQRAHKGIFNDLWDVSVGGGVITKEPSAHAAVRELHEELGLQADEADLDYLGRFKMPKVIPETGQQMNDHSDSYLLIRKVAVEQLVLQTAEVAATKQMSLADLQEQVTNPQTANLWVPHPVDYYKQVIATIIDRL